MLTPTNWHSVCRFNTGETAGDTRPACAAEETHVEDYLDQQLERNPHTGTTIHHIASSFRLRQNQRANQDQTRFEQDQTTAPTRMHNDSWPRWHSVDDGKTPCPLPVRRREHPRLTAHAIGARKMPSGQRGGAVAVRLTTRMPCVTPAGGHAAQRARLSRRRARLRAYPGQPAKVAAEVDTKHLSRICPMLSAGSLKPHRPISSNWTPALTNHTGRNPRHATAVSSILGP
ncbi:hypothetical protein B0T16DRAFT_54611 [Cercophora newfieldiana]|uniref:Uncharacterized protein n=1 Tax=Cercophora newfieldiana TaxID=92897 RepID=A0AA39YS93_9PEZI|nr:hypothetical protein B0T16DRAFT_54611 [Cercophora newfieldiana]